MASICLLLFIFLILLTVHVLLFFYALTLQEALNRVSPRNRLMEPGMVWLVFVPVFNIIWQIIIAWRVPGSLRNEFRELGRDDGSNYGKGLGLTQASVGIFGVVAEIVSYGLTGGIDQDLNRAHLISGIALTMILIAMFLFIMFWVKVGAYSSLLRLRDLERKLEQFDDDNRGPATGGSSVPPHTFKEGDPGRYQ